MGHNLEDRFMVVYLSSPGRLVPLGLRRWCGPSSGGGPWGKMPSIRSMVVLILLWSRMSARDLSLPMMSLASSWLFWSSPYVAAGASGGAGLWLPGSCVAGAEGRSGGFSVARSGGYSVGRAMGSMGVLGSLWGGL